MTEHKNMTFSKPKEIKASIKNMVKGNLSRPKGMYAYPWLKPPQHVMYGLEQSSHKCVHHVSFLNYDLKLSIEAHTL